MINKITLPKTLLFISITSLILNLIYFLFLVFLIYPNLLDAYTKADQAGIVRTLIPKYLKFYASIFAFSLGSMLLSLDILVNKKGMRPGLITKLLILIAIIVLISLIFRVLPYYQDIPKALFGKYP